MSEPMTQPLWAPLAWLNNSTGGAWARDVLLAIDTRNTHAVDGRFKGGYITRHYGRPHDGIHAVQLEMCQSLYMQEVSPFTYDEARAAQIQPTLKHLLQIMLGWTPSGSTR